MRRSHTRSGNSREVSLLDLTRGIGDRPLSTHWKDDDRAAATGAQPPGPNALRHVAPPGCAQPKDTAALQSATIRCSDRRDLLHAVGTRADDEGIMRATTTFYLGRPEHLQASGLRSTIHTAISGRLQPTRFHATTHATLRSSAAVLGRDPLAPSSRQDAAAQQLLAAGDGVSEPRCRLGRDACAGGSAVPPEFRS